VFNQPPSYAAVRVRNGVDCTMGGDYLRKDGAGRLYIDMLSHQTPHRLDLNVACPGMLLERWQFGVPQAINTSHKALKARLPCDDDEYNGLYRIFFS